MADDQISSTSVTRLKKASKLWIYGFKEACCFHRVVSLCLRSRELLIRTGQCFLLNGFIFLGSIIFLNLVIIPSLLRILPEKIPVAGLHGSFSCGCTMGFYPFLRFGLLQFFYIFWFLPMYLLSFILSTMWYNDIAKHGFAVIGSRQRQPTQKEASSSNILSLSERPAGLGGVMIGIGEQVYSLLLLSVFFAEVYAVGFIPYIGKAINFVLLSWMYAFYCFEYKWNNNGVPLDRRLDFFESNWPFFWGFGSPCVIAILVFSPLVSYGVMAVLFPLFVLTAATSASEQLIYADRREWKGVDLGRLPIFYAADTLSMKLLSCIPVDSSAQAHVSLVHKKST